ncbi:polysaccharide deacetylase family protein [Legionella sp. CNM-1927-20]|uniref:polysaccharide deacetylase family protein n=1 Tax=Legionella sp. CNM-1927-20 TaxID=3422221 RepID=UPI00403ACC7B
MKFIYLTIDDSPSEHMIERVNFLYEHEIPAIFFCRGELLAENQTAVVHAIKLGFLIGNHSYSHPYFSETENEVFYNEILATEKLIDECYLQAGCQRPGKFIRLPFGDRGAGGYLKKAITEAQLQKVESLQNFLRQHDFKPLNFGNEHNDGCIDALWTLDTEDYKKELKNNPDTYFKLLSSKVDASKFSSEVMLMHDFGAKIGNNFHLFKKTIQIILEQNICFLPISYDPGISLKVQMKHHFFKSNGGLNDNDQNEISFQPEKKF